MEVDGEGVHDGDFRLQAAEHAGQGLTEGLGVGQPGIPGVEVTADGEMLPVFEFLPDEFGGLTGLEAEGVAAEINGVAGGGRGDGGGGVRGRGLIGGRGRGGIGGECGGGRWNEKPGAKAVELILPVFLLSE